MWHTIPVIVLLSARAVAACVSMTPSARIGSAAVWTMQTLPSVRAAAVARSSVARANALRMQAQLLSQTEFEELPSRLDAVRALRPSEQSPAVQASLWYAAGLNPMFKVSENGTTG